jgi:hypothetical protein
MSDSPDLTINPVFARIKAVAAEEVQFTILIGYISEATVDLVTVYPTLDLRMYLEIPRGDIIWAEKAVPSQQYSPTKFVIKGSCKVKRVTCAERNSEEGFLSGSIIGKHLHTAAPGVTVEVKVFPEGVGPPVCPSPHAGGSSKTGSTLISQCHHTGVCFSDAVY